MKKIFLILILTTAYLTNMTAQEFPIYDCELVKTFNVGTGDGELMTNPKSPYESIPTGLGFDKQGNLYICDGGNLRVVKYDSNYTYVKEYKNGNCAHAKQLFFNDREEFIGYFDEGIVVDDQHGNRKINVTFSFTYLDNKFDNNPNFIYVDNMIITYMKDGSLISIPDPVVDYKKNLEKILNEDETIKYLQEKYGTQDTKSKTVRTNNGTLTIDQNGNIIVDGEIKTRNSNNFFKYKEKDRNNVKVNLTKNSNIVTKHIDGFTEEFINNLTNTTYLGKDIDNNYYWRLGSFRILVFNRDSFLINAFKFDKEKTRVIPAIHPSGDVYFLDYDDKQVYLYRIKRVW